VGRGIASLEVEKWLRAWIGRRLAVTADRIDPSKPFADFGIDSVTAVELNAALAEWLQTPLPATVCWDFPNIRALAGSIVPSLSAAKAPPPAATSRASRDLDELSQTELAALLAAELKTLR
jgi:acyl carrier protein